MFLGATFVFTLFTTTMVVHDEHIWVKDGYLYVDIMHAALSDCCVGTKTTVIFQKQTTPSYLGDVSSCLALHGLAWRPSR